QWLDNDDTAKTVLLSIEKQSEHPLADAVVKYFSQETAVELSNFESITGKGVQADYNNQTYYAGNKKLMSENNISIKEELQRYADLWGKDSKTVIWFSDSTQALAVVAIADQIKATSVQAIKGLQDMGIELYML